jgi:hypothetical protein
VAVASVREPAARVLDSSVPSSSVPLSSGLFHTLMMAQVTAQGHGDDRTDDAAEDRAGGECDQDDERMQCERSRHHYRLKQVALQLLHDYDDRREDQPRTVGMATK